MVKQQLVGFPSILGLLHRLDVKPAFMLSANGAHGVPNSAPVISEYRSRVRGAYILQSSRSVLAIEHRFNCVLCKVLLPLMMVLVTTHLRKGNFTSSWYTGHSLLMLHVKHRKFEVGLSPDIYIISSMRANHGIIISSNCGSPAWAV
jgi:hypothetical protein